MATVIKRLRVNVQYDIVDSLECFYSSGDQLTGDPSTVITYNGQEYFGGVEFDKKDGEFIIVIRMKN